MYVDDVLRVHDVKRKGKGRSESSKGKSEGTFLNFLA